MAASGVTFVFDENSAGLLNVLRTVRAEPLGCLTDLPSIGIPNGTLDPELLSKLGARGSVALIARDGKMLGPVLQRNAWRLSGVTLFLLSKRWGQLPLFELSRRLLFLWPGLVAHATDGGKGVAWRINPTIPAQGPGSFRLVTGLHAAEGLD